MSGMKPIMSDKDSTFSFEDAIGELESIVRKMERGDLSLEDSLSAFEEGIKLTKDCQKALNEAEQKVVTLVENNDGLSESTFENLDESQ